METKTVRAKTVSVEEVARESRIVTHEEAREAVMALVDEHFHCKSGRGTQFSIPPKPKDTDVLLLAYIRQQKARG